mgnify:CR=1 FL=1
MRNLSLQPQTAKTHAETPKTTPAIPDTSIIETLLENAMDNIPIISLDENDGQDGSAQNISSQLGAGRDPFLNAATFKFKDKLYTTSALKNKIKKSKNANYKIHS